MRLALTTLVLASLLSVAFTRSAPAQERMDLSSATDTDHSAEYDFDGGYCERPLLVTDVLKDLGHGLQLEIIELTSNTVSDAEERELADSVDTLLRDQLPIVEDPELDAYFASLLDTLQPFMTRDLEYQVVLFESPLPNAFALPGGKILVSTGLTHVVTNEAQMIGVLAHELGHHELRHVIAHVQYLKLLGLWSPEALTEGLASAAVGTLAMPLQSRQEQAADVFAVDVAFKLGYSPHQIGQLMLVFDLYYSEHIEETGDSFAGFLISETLNLIEDHPRPRLRACTINDEIRLRSPKDADTVFYVGHENFQKRIPAAEELF